jgi:hypothetical protein
MSTRMYFASKVTRMLGRGDGALVFPGVRPPLSQLAFRVDLSRPGAFRSTRTETKNTNGLLRQFFPKGKGLAVCTPEDLSSAEKLLNSRPRKILDWRTPDPAVSQGLP